MSLLGLPQLSYGRSTKIEEYKLINRIHDRVNTAVSTIVPIGTDWRLVQVSINAMATTGGTISFGPGTYDFTTCPGFTIPGNNISIAGTGWGTVLKYKGSVIGPLFKAVDTTQRVGFSLSDMQLKSDGAGTGVDLSHFAISQLRNVDIDSVLIGIDINSADAFYNDIDFVRVNLVGAGSIGIRIQNGANENTVRRSRVICDSSVAGNSTGYIVDAYSSELAYCDCEYNAAVAFDIRAGGHATVLMSPYAELNVINLQLANGVTNVTVIGGEVKDGTTGNMFTNNVNDLGAINCQFLGTRFQRLPTPMSFTNSGSFAATTTPGGSDSTTAPHPLILFEQPLPSVANSWRDSDSIILRGRAYDGSTQYAVDYRMYVGVTSGTGNSALHFQERINSSAFADKFVVDGSGLLTISGRFILGGSIKPAYAKATGPATVAVAFSTNCVMAADTTAGAVTYNLPAAAGFGGTEFTFKRISASANNATVVPAGADTIDGGGTYTLSAQWKYIRLMSDSVSNWLIVGSN